MAESYSDRWYEEELARRAQALALVLEKYLDGQLREGHDARKELREVLELYQQAHRGNLEGFSGTCALCGAKDRPLQKCGERNVCRPTCHAHEGKPEDGVRVVVATVQEPSGEVLVRLKIGRVVMGLPPAQAEQLGSALVQAAAHARTQGSLN